MSYHLSRASVLVLFCLAGSARSAAVAPPVPTDDRLTVDLVAAEPDIVTPTGITVDLQGRIWVIESNTHFPPKNYTRHPTDRLMVLEDFGPDGRARKITPFADGFMQAMSLSVTPKGKIFVTCRNEIVQFENVDGKPENRKTLVKLDTKATYPHNGLNGITFSPDGAFLYFCLGLNTGYDYTVIGSDGSKVAGGGEGGSIWRCKPDGSKVERIATGFWNCHDLTFDAFGRLFAVDNDPDDRGPCRLLDIIEGGDYGWKFKNGRKGVHPFTSWNVELPGTLPMVAPTGEAPSGILAYESDGLPSDYLGQLLVTSWGDHILQRYTLKEKGASFESRPQTFLRGGEDFRPVGIAQSPDGSVLLSDWVDKSYTLHGKGRVWRVRAKTPPKDDGVRADQLAGKSVEELAKLLGHPKREVREAAGDELSKQKSDVLKKTLLSVVSGPANDRAKLQALWTEATLDDASACEIIAYVAFTLRPRLDDGEAEAVRLLAERGGEPWRAKIEERRGRGGYRRWFASLPKGTPVERLEPFATCPDPFVATTAALVASRTGDVNGILASLEKFHDDGVRLSAALVLRRMNSDAARAVMPRLLHDPTPETRKVALQWIGEDRLTQFADQIPTVLKSGPVTRDLLEAYLACQEKLTSTAPESGKPPVERSGRQLAAGFLADEKQDLALRKLAITLIDPADPKLPAKTLISLIEPMGLDAVGALAWRQDGESQKVLREIAADENKPADWRREAAQGLAFSAGRDEATKAALSDMLHHAHKPALHLEAMRSLRGLLANEDAKQILPSLHKALKKPGLGTAEERRDWAEQILLAFRSTPAALTDDERKELKTLAGDRPATEAQWQEALKEGGDPEEGRRVFALANGARCFVCHQIDNRGGDVGPDLSVIARSMDRKKIVESNLFPSREIAPMYEPLVLELKDGRTLTGVGLNEAGAEYVTIADATGKRERIKADEIERRRTDKISIMPENLADGMTLKEFRDLVAFLASRK